MLSQGLGSSGFSADVGVRRGRETHKGNEGKSIAWVLWQERARAGEMLVLGDLWAHRARLWRSGSSHLQGTIRSKVGWSPGVRSGKDDLIISQVG